MNELSAVPHHLGHLGPGWPASSRRHGTARMCIYVCNVCLRDAGGRVGPAEQRIPLVNQGRRVQAGRGTTPLLLWPHQVSSRMFLMRHHCARPPLPTPTHPTPPLNTSPHTCTAHAPTHAHLKARLLRPAPKPIGLVLLLLSQGGLHTKGGGGLGPEVRCRGLVSGGEKDAGGWCPEVRKMQEVGVRR